AAVVKGQLLHERHHSTQPGGVVGSDVGQRAHVVLRHHQQVNGRGRIDVVKGDELIVFVNLLGGNVARGDLAKNTGVAHVCSYQESGRAAFSARPETPSRRSSSFRICSGRTP